MRFHSRAFAGTALGLLMTAATSAAGAQPVVDGNSGIKPAPVIMAQADSDNPFKKAIEKRKAKAAEKDAERQARKQKHQDQGGQTEDNAAQAPVKDRSQAMKPERKGHSDEDVGQAREMKRDKGFRQQDEAKVPDKKEPADDAQSSQRSQPKPKKFDNAKGFRSQPAAKSQMPADNAKPENNAATTDDVQSPDKRRDKDRRHSNRSQDRNNPSPENARTGQRTDQNGGVANDSVKGGSDTKAGVEETSKPQPPANAGTRQIRPGEKQPMQGENGGKGRDTNQAGTALPENAGPVLDSDKNQRGRDRGKEQAGRNDRQDHQGRNRNRGDNDNSARQQIDAGPPPRSDAAAQDFRRQGKFKVESADAIKGKRIEGDRVPHWQRPKDADVVKDFGSRVIINLGGQTIVQSTDHDRLRHHARDTYYEDLPHDRTRETIERPDGSRVVTIRNEYGDVIRRSRFTPDGREIVLVYVDERDLDRDRGRGWRDPGDDLPPMRLTVPVSRYILDSEDVRDPNRYYEFLDQPPVEKVERLYTLGEVRRSARLRDKLPRIDLDTINFDTGSAEISPDQADDLQGVAEAMKRIIDRNPGETFLIEGHTDAVGDPNSNLALSDERAESVADLLTNDFGIPPENLVTQGYGEEYLKIDTDGPSRENRRVAIRRITPLVSPVAQR